MLIKNKSSSNTDIENCMTFTQTVPYGRNINEAYPEKRINIYGNQKTKSSMTLPRLLSEVIISATIGFTAFRKLYHQYSFKIMDGSLIVNLILLGQCFLKAISLNHW